MQLLSHKLLYFKFLCIFVLFLQVRVSVEQKGHQAKWAVWFPVNTIDWLNISLINLYYYDVDSAIVGMNASDSRIQDSGLGSFFLVFSNNPTPGESDGSYSFHLFLSSFYSWSSPYPPQPSWKRNHQKLKELNIDWHIIEVVNWNQKNGKNIEISRWLERYGDCIQKLALTIAGFICFCGSQPGMILPPKGHLTMCGDIFRCHNLRVGYWNLVNRVQECC